MSMISVFGSRGAAATAGGLPPQPVTSRSNSMHVFVTGASGHVGSYVIPELDRSRPRGHRPGPVGQVRGLRCPRSARGSAAEILSTSKRSRRRPRNRTASSISGYRAELLRSGGIVALRDSELSIVLAFGEALAGTGKPLVVAGSIGTPTNVGRAGRIGAPVSLGRPATEEDPALPAAPWTKALWCLATSWRQPWLASQSGACAPRSCAFPSSYTVRPVGYR